MQPCYATQRTCQSGELVAGAQRPPQLIQNLIFSLTPEDYSTNDCARLSLSLGSPGGSTGTAWLWDVVLRVVPTADDGNNAALSSATSGLMTASNAIYFLSSLASFASAIRACWPASETALRNAAALLGVVALPETMLRNRLSGPVRVSDLARPVGLAKAIYRANGGFVQLLM
jgi:hypothetical protein